MIFHITTQREWATAVSAGQYRNDSLDIEGFIHCSTSQQLIGSANKHFREQTGLVLLCIMPENVAAPLIYEDSYQTGQIFPHIYGALNINAVTQVIPFPVSEDGSYSLPDELNRQFDLLV